MKIAYVDQSGELGGGELSLFDIVTRLPHSARVVLLSDGPFREMLEAAAIEVEVLKAGTLSDVRLAGSYSSLINSVPAVYRLKKELQKIAGHDDVLYANSQKAFILCAFVARATGRPLIWHLRDILTVEHFSSLLAKAAVRLANRYASRVIANSRATREAFVQLGGNPSCVRVVYNGISADAFNSVTEGAAEALRETIAPEAEFLVGVFGRVSSWKGQHILVEALRSLPGVHALIVGDALFGETEYARRLEEMAQAPEVRGRIHFLGFRKDIPALMKAVDVVVHTSTAPEPFGRVLVEGMLAARPVIGTDAGGAAEIIQHEKTGLLVPPSDVKALAEWIAALQRDPELAGRLAVAGRQSAEASFSLEAMLAGVEDVVQSVLVDR